MRKQPETTEKTRKAFVDVFCDLYKQKPIDRITVQEITRHSGYNRSTFYQYFPDIYALLDYVENDVLSYIRDMPSSDIVTGKLSDALIHRIALLFTEKGDSLMALLGDYGSVRFTDKIKAKMMENASEASLYPKDNPLVPYIQEFSVSAAVSMFRYWYRNNKSISSEELVDLTRKLLTEGVLAQIRRLALEPDTNNMKQGAIE